MHRPVRQRLEAGENVRRPPTARRERHPHVSAVRTDDGVIVRIAVSRDRRGNPEQHPRERQHDREPDPARRVRHRNQARGDSENSHNPFLVLRSFVRRIGGHSVLVRQRPHQRHHAHRSHARHFRRTQ